MVIAVDFDGTCVKHRFPYVGEPIGAEYVLKELVENGHKLILYTMRSHPLEGSGDKDLTSQNLVPTKRDTLEDAITWFKDNGLPLYGVNENPSQHFWTQSPKAYANLYIDDAALGCPLKSDDEGNVFVDWVEVAHRLHDDGYLTVRQLRDILNKIESL